MDYVVILRENSGRLRIKYLKENPELTQNPEEKIIYYEAYKNRKVAYARFNSLKLYAKAWAQLKRRILGEDK